MKKTKLLIPVLSIAGLGATVAPMVVMTSCGCTDATVVTLEEKDYDTETQSYSVNVTHKAGKYKTAITIPKNHFADTFGICYYNLDQKVYVTNAIKSVKFVINNNVKELKLEESIAWIYDKKDIDWTSSHKIELEWENNSIEGNLLLIIGKMPF